MRNINPPINRLKLVVVLGPTASGKSDLGIKLSKKFNGEIISADSRQVYKKMDVGTGKVTKKEQRLAKHHLLDVIDPREVFTVSDFKKLGQKTITNIVSRGKLPIVVGGTGFYIDALVKGFVIPEVPTNKKLRTKLEKKTAENLYKELKKLDPKRARSIDSKNKRRLVRALEIIKITGKPVPKLSSSAQYQTLWIGLKPEDLEKRIKLRLDKRLNQGMIKEVEGLLKAGVSKKRLYDFGLEYRWISEYPSGKISYDEMKNGLYKAIVKYSKRQMTWFKRNKEIHWVKNKRGADKLIKKFIFPPRASYH